MAFFSFSKKLLVSCVVIGSMTLAGCQTTGSTATNNTDPRLTNTDSAKFFSKSGYQACAVTAGVAVLACLASNSSNKATCAVAAGILACGVAMGANYYLDDRRSQYSNTTQRLQAMTYDVQQDTEKVIQRTQVAQQVIHDDQERIAQIKRDISNKQVNIAQAKKELAEIDNNIALLNRDITNMKEKANEYGKVAAQERRDGAGNQVAAMEREITRMNQKVAVLQQEVDGLYRQRSAITLG